jgi:hypothetical protein
MPVSDGHGEERAEIPITTPLNLNHLRNINYFSTPSYFLGQLEEVTRELTFGRFPRTVKGNKRLRLHYELGGGRRVVIFICIQK